MWIKNATQWILTWSWGSVPFGSGRGTPGVRWGWSPYWWWWTSHHLKSLKMNVTVQKIAQKINKYIPWAPEVWILLYPPPFFFWISLVGIFSSKCMNISIKYKWIKIKFTHFREIIITITTNQKKGQVRGMIVVSKLKVLSHTPVLDFNTYNSWRRAQSSWGKSWWELHLWGRTRHRWHTCTMKKRVEFPLVFFTF